MNNENPTTQPAMAAATPRTDEAQCRFPRNPDLIMDLVPFGAVVPVDFARQLETELSALRAELAAAKAALQHYARADFLTTEQQSTAENALKKCQHQNLDTTRSRDNGNGCESELAQLRADLAAKGEWQPIETADPRKAAILYQPEKTARMGMGLAARIIVDAPISCTHRKPTYWMPLPAAPAPSAHTANKGEKP